MMVSDIEIAIRLILAAILCGLVGLERERKRRAAGLRTHCLVGAGACLIMLTGLYIAALYSGQATMDPSRLAAQVVSGIGFLGAGTIIQHKDYVRGLTTAASIWVSAGIGLAAGAGFYVGALVTTFIVLAVLFIVSGIQRKVRGA